MICGYAYYNSDLLGVTSFPELLPLLDLNFILTFTKSPNIDFML